MSHKCRKLRSVTTDEKRSLNVANNTGCSKRGQPIGIMFLGTIMVYSLQHRTLI